MEMHYRSGFEPRSIFEIDFFLLEFFQIFLFEFFQNFLFEFFKKFRIRIEILQFWNEVLLVIILQYTGTYYVNRIFFMKGGPGKSCMGGMLSFNEWDFL